MKKYLLSVIISFTILIGQAQRPGWQNLDLRIDSLFGVSTERAYRELLKGKKANTVIVAIIDNGIDTAHEDLKDIIWTNKSEIPGNGIDDDHNGYIDDIHGWNFIGSETGIEDVTRLVLPNKDFYDSLSYTRVPEQYRVAYRFWKKIWNDYSNHVSNAQSFISQVSETKKLVDNIIHKIGKLTPTLKDFEQYTPDSKEESQIIDIIKALLPKYKDFAQYERHEIDEQLDHMNFHADHGLSLSYGGKITSQQNNKWAKGNYGDNDISGPCTLLLPNPGPYHGTHLAGIIGANRDNGLGVQGIANHVLIMSLRVSSFYRELRDKDLANAIRYAADNGARVINLSFGKLYTVDKNLVDEAVKYAMKKDILIVHAAGNEGKNIEQETIYPCAFYQKGGKRANAWINVGASCMKDDVDLVAPFSNYGKSAVDVFAPGVGIHSTIPISKYTSFNGTSMASPVVAGVAALIMEYYPKLTALQIKNIIMTSVVKINHDVQVIDQSKRSILIPFSETCVSGGIVNVYNALLLADKISH